MAFPHWRVLACAPIAAAAAQAPLPRALFVSTEIAAAARSVPLGGALLVDGVPLDGAAAPASLELFRFAAFAPEARIAVHGATSTELLPAPDNAYFHGFVTGDPWSQAFLTVRAGGNVRGLVASGGRKWVFDDRRGSRSLPVPVVREVDPIALGVDFACAVDRLPPGPRRADVPSAGSAAPAGAAGHTARVALETDFEYFQLFGNVIDAADYAADLLAYSSGIYVTETETQFHITHLSLWTSPADPWAQTDSVCALLEFGRYWNDNYGGQAGGDVYSVAHMLSGKNAGGGVAWLGVLCGGPFNYNHGGDCPGLSPQNDNYGGPYGFSGSLDGDFDPMTGQVVWDLVVVSHEIGHNFDSPHTHCYAGLGGNPDPVDECWGSEPGCYSGQTSLPCPDPPGPGSGCGTLMSYCHLLSGGIGNMGPTFGLGHPWGVEPERVPERMHAFVLDTAAADPACLAPVADLFADGFESGGTAFWDQAVE